jgi:hypothetical protein
LILPILVTPSKQRTRMWFAPIISSALPNISRFRFWGSFTLMISSPGGDPGFLSVSTTSPLVFSGLWEVRITCSIFSVRENIFIPYPDKRCEVKLRRNFSEAENSFLFDMEGSCRIFPLLEKYSCNQRLSARLHRYYKEEKHAGTKTGNKYS